MLGLREIMGLVHIRHRPSAVQREDAEDQQRFDDGPPTRRRSDGDRAELVGVGDLLMASDIGLA